MGKSKMHKERTQLTSIADPIEQQRLALMIRNDPEAATLQSSKRRLESGVTFKAVGHRKTGNSSRPPAIAPEDLPDLAPPSDMLPTVHAPAAAGDSVPESAESPPDSDAVPTVARPPEAEARQDGARTTLRIPLGHIHHRETTTARARRIERASNPPAVREPPRLGASESQLDAKNETRLALGAGVLILAAMLLQLAAWSASRAGAPRTPASGATPTATASP